MTMKKGTVDVEKLINFAIRAFQKVGVPEEDARIAARLLVATDLIGVDTHGVNRLTSHYISGIKERRINAKPQVKVFSNTLSTAVMDGDRGLGFVVGSRAMLEAIHRAETTGAGFVAVRNSTHFGACGNYARIALEHDMIGISLSQGGSRGSQVAPGSRGKGGIGNSILAIAAPSKSGVPFVLDMATGVIASGKLRPAIRDNRPIPEGWAVDIDGNPVTDPVKATGGVLPLGGTPQLGVYKGFGLGVVVEILSSVLSGGLSVPEKQSIPDTMVPATSHFFGALRIDGFRPIDEFKEGMDAMSKAYHELPKAAGVDRIYLAGEIEHETERQRRQGIPLHPGVIAQLQELAEELGIEYNL